MRDVLIIGDGFDLYHKLPTRYIDFLFLAKHWNVFYLKYTENEKSEASVVDFVLATVDVSDGVKEKIPDMALPYVNENDRGDCEVILRR